jgi:hypothetical protein
MKSHPTVVAACLLAGLALTVSRAMGQAINGAVIKTRVFNDDPDSIVSTNNLYPALISIKDDKLDGDGAPPEFANRHNFRLSDNGGISAAVFNNSSKFSFFTDLTLTGPANSEGGINVSPWWSKDVDGVFTAITGNGEIAAFGGRLPFYSFNSHMPPVNYVKGETIRLGVNYDPHSLTMADPGTIEYFVTKNGVTYSSGVIPFDEGNPNEPYGTWGILEDARVGGYFQPQIKVGNPDNWGQVDFGKMEYVPEPASLILLGLGGLALLRRRR